MPNFNNVTLGGAQVEVGPYGGAYTNIGYTDGDIDFNRSAELKKLIDGIPLTTVGQVLLKEEVTAKIPAVEMTASNIANASLNLGITTTPGATVTITDGANQEKTFASNPQNANGVLESINLDGGTVTGLVVKNVAESTTYATPGDYTLDAATGVVYRNPSGTITSGQTVRVHYSYVQLAAERIKLGVNNALSYKKVKLTHTSPVSGKIIIVELWRCLASGTLPLSFKKEEWMKVDIDLTALPDSAHPTEPIGYIEIQTP